MPRWLLKAEADKIQATLFRSTKLRQVLGASSLIADFGGAVLDSLIAASGLPCQVLARDGGAITLCVTSDDQQAVACLGAAIADAYALHTDGTMSVAQPDEIIGAAFAEAYAKVEASLRARKRSAATVAADLLPYYALCDTCGVAAARTLTGTGYTCAACASRSRQHAADVNPDLDRVGRFLQPVVDAMVAIRDARRRTDASLPPLDGTALYQARDFDALAKLNPGRSRDLGFLVADGNAMGVYFSAVRTERDLAARSRCLEWALRFAVAWVNERMLRIPSLATERMLPAVPLILAGDDMFMALPAAYALAAADAYACAFEVMMQADPAWFIPAADAAEADSLTIDEEALRQQLAHYLVDRLCETVTVSADTPAPDVGDEAKVEPPFADLPPADPPPAAAPSAPPTVTVGMGLVIGPATTPYTVAHEFAHAELMGAAKRLTKNLAARSANRAVASALSFHRLVGSDRPAVSPHATATTTAAGAADAPVYVSGFQPYVVGVIGRQKREDIADAALHLAALLTAQTHLSASDDLPRAGRIDDLRKLYDLRARRDAASLTPTDFSRMLREIVRRAGRFSPGTTNWAEALLITLGDACSAEGARACTIGVECADGYWRRRAFSADSRLYHALPDAIAVRGFAERLPE